MEVIRPGRLAALLQGTCARCGCVVQCEQEEAAFINRGLEGFRWEVPCPTPSCGAQIIVAVPPCPTCGGC